MSAFDTLVVCKFKTIFSNLLVALNIFCNDTWKLPKLVYQGLLQLTYQE
jgi:hypothetical protein